MNHNSSAPFLYPLFLNVMNRECYPLTVDLSPVTCRLCFCVPSILSGHHRPGSCGRLMAGAEMKIDKPDD